MEKENDQNREFIIYFDNPGDILITNEDIENFLKENYGIEDGISYETKRNEFRQMINDTNDLWNQKMNLK